MCLLTCRKQLDGHFNDIQQSIEALVSIKFLKQDLFQVLLSTLLIMGQSGSILIEIFMLNSSLLKVNFDYTTGCGMPPLSDF